MHCGGAYTTVLEDSASVAAAAPVPLNERPCHHHTRRIRIAEMDLDAGTLAAFYYRAVREYDLPSKDCVVAPGQDEKMTHASLDKHAYAYALGLADALGVKRGSKVALWLQPGDLEGAVLQYAITLAGGVTVCIDARAGFDAVLRILGEEAVRVLVLSPRFGAEDRAAALSTVFAAELAAAAVEGGTEPLLSKRFRQLKFLVTTGGDAVSGVVRLKDVPVYGVGELSVHARS